MLLMASLFTWQFPHMPRFFKFWGWYVRLYIHTIKKVCLYINTIRKSECWRTDAFELWCWRRLLRVPWTVRKSNQPILKEISPECSLERLMLKLKLQYFGHLMRRTDSFEKTLIVGNIEGEEKGTTEDEMVGWHYRLDGRKFEQAPGAGDGQGSLASCSP